jgi:2-hydroxyacyl-CoA lyase 1
MEGADFIAECLKRVGIKHMFGVIGLPVTPIAVAAQKKGIEFFGMRNEQSGGYAASIVGYLAEDNIPAVMLTVSVAIMYVYV